MKDPNKSIYEVLRKFKKPIDSTSLIDHLRVRFSCVGNERLYDITLSFSNIDKSKQYYLNCRLLAPISDSKLPLAITSSELDYLIEEAKILSIVMSEEEIVRYNRVFVVRPISLYSIRSVTLRFLDAIINNKVEPFLYINSWFQEESDKDIEDNILKLRNHLESGIVIGNVTVKLTVLGICME